MSRRILLRMGDECRAYVEYDDERGFELCEWDDEPVPLGMFHPTAAARLTKHINRALGVQPWVELGEVLREVVLPVALSLLVRSRR